jgi:hypoxanthine phosphoribosyltransferase
MAKLRERQPASLKAAVLLDKRSRRTVDAPVDYIGFEVPDRFLVGYGLDRAGQYRNLPYIAVLKQE